MWFLKEVFDDIVDITTTPIRVTWKVADKIIYPFEDGIDFFWKWADKLRDTLKWK